MSERRRQGALVLVLMLWPMAASAQTLPTSDVCRECHLTLEDERLAEPARAYEADVHAAAGFGCLACHGSGGMSELDERAGFLSAPDRIEIPGMCGRCHSDPLFMRQYNPGLRVDQVLEYQTSAHGRLLLQADDPDVATCADCHQAHSIRSPSDPESSVYVTNVVATCGRCHSDAERMAGRGLAVNQVDEYSSSVHGLLVFADGDLSAPVCNDCHGNHGAAPPGVSSVRNVCGQCHSVMADYFAESAHVSVFEERELPACALCHNHHAIEPISDEQLIDRSGEVCADCHEAADTLGGEFVRMAALLDSLDRATEASRRTLEEAENLGMEVSQAQFELEDVTNARTRARSAIHTFHSDAVGAEVETGLEIVARAEERGQEALSEHSFRRVGLGASSVIIVLLITGLLLRIKDTDEQIDRVLESVESYYDRTFAKTISGSTTPEELRLAACALLLEATYADGRFSDEERAHLEDLLSDRFGLTSADAQELIALAESQRDAPGDVGQLAAKISEGFTIEQKRNLITELWVLVYADGELAEHELEFLEDVSALLGVTEATVAAARRRVAEKP